MSDYESKVREILGKLHSGGVEKIIAFSGGSDSDEPAKSIAEAGINVLQNYPVAILTGGTVWGLPKYATLAAKSKGIPTIGVFPSRGRKYALECLDYEVEVSPRYGESEWGDESEIFAKLADGVEIIEGGAGTMIEFAHIMKMNEARVKNGRKPVYVVPVLSLNMKGKMSLADYASNLPIKPEVRAVSMPEREIYTGAEASEFLVKVLGLNPKAALNDVVHER